MYSTGPNGSVILAQSESFGAGPVLVAPESFASDADSGESSGELDAGSQMRRSRIKNRHLLHNTRFSEARPESLLSSHMARTCLSMKSFNI